MFKFTFFLFFLISSNVFASNFKMSCKGNFGPSEFFIENYLVSDTEIQLYQATYYLAGQPDPFRNTRKENKKLKIIKKEEDWIYAIPLSYLESYDYIGVNLEQSKIYFYKIHRSEPDLKNRTTENTLIVRSGICAKIN